MVQAFGMSYWEDIGKLKPILVNGSEGMISTVVQGERLAGPIHNYTIGTLIDKNQPIGYSVPAEGGIPFPAYVAIAHGTSKLDAAKKFYDFMISKDAAALSVAHGMFSTRIDMPGPKGWPSIGEVKTMPFDWAQHSRSKAEIKAKFSEIMEK
jgi:iron(III) transport system substrate-binding protein